MEEPLQPGIAQVLVTYNQKADDMSPDHEEQFLEIRTEDSGAGVYYVLKTERWAIDDIDELIGILKDFKRRAEVKY